MTEYEFSGKCIPLIIYIYIQEPILILEGWESKRTFNLKGVFVYKDLVMFELMLNSLEEE